MSISRAKGLIWLLDGKGGQLCASATLRLGTEPPEHFFTFQSKRFVEEKELLPTDTNPCFVTYDV